MKNENFKPSINREGWKGRHEIQGFALIYLTT